MKNKRGKKASFQLSIETLVILVLAILLLIALVVGFTTGWKKFWLTLTGFFKSDVDVTKQACEMACKNEEENNFCCKQREIKIDNKIEKISCKDTRLNIECDINCQNVKC